MYAGDKNRVPRKNYLPFPFRKVENKAKGLPIIRTCPCVHQLMENVKCEGMLGLGVKI